MSTKPHQFTNGGDAVLILRRTGADMKSKNGFIYPKEIGAVVTAPDWTDNSQCGGGLHGWPWGLGLGEGSDYELGDTWMVIAAKPEDIVGELENGWKCKFRTGTIKHVGDFAGALAMVRDGFHACIKEMATAPSAEGASDKNSSQLAASGDSSQLAASGDSSQLAASGDYSKLAASGDSSQLAASGYSSQLAASGDSSKLAASGDYSKLAASGDYSKLEVTGKNSVAAVAAPYGRFKGALGTAFALAYRLDDNSFEFVCGKVGRDGIKADTWYEVQSGKLVEVAL